MTRIKKERFCIVKLNTIINNNSCNHNDYNDIINYIHNNK